MAEKTNKPLFIVDSSVIIKWLTIEEKDFKQAEKLKNSFIDNEIELATTTLAPFEILNFLSRKHPKYTTRVYSEMLNLKLTNIHLSLEISATANNIVQELEKVSFYDASFHAAAKFHQGTFITADEKYYKKAKKLKDIILLKNFD